LKFLGHVTRGEHVSDHIAHIRTNYTDDYKSVKTSGLGLRIAGKDMAQ